MPKTAIENIMPDEIAALEPKYRDVLSVYASGARYLEIAETLNIPIGTVRSRLNRARGCVLGNRAAAAQASS